MGIEGEDFINNPNQIELVDDEDIDLEDAQFLIDYNDEEEEDDYIGDEFDDVNQHQSWYAFDVADDDEDDSSYNPDSDNFLTDSEDDSDGELRGRIIDGVFVTNFALAQEPPAVEVQPVAASETNGNSETEELKTVEGEPATQNQTQTHQQPANS